MKIMTVGLLLLICTACGASQADVGSGESRGSIAQTLLPDPENNARFWATRVFQLVERHDRDFLTDLFNERGDLYAGKHLSTSVRTRARGGMSGDDQFKIIIDTDLTGKRMVSDTPPHPESGRSLMKGRVGWFTNTGDLVREWWDHCRAYCGQSSGIAIMFRNPAHKDCFMRGAVEHTSDKDRQQWCVMYDRRPEDCAYPHASVAHPKEGCDYHTLTIKQTRSREFTCTVKGENWSCQRTDWDEQCEESINRDEPWEGDLCYCYKNTLRNFDDGMASHLENLLAENFEP